MSTNINVSTLALFGGTFDPVHNGHLLVAHSLFEILPLTELIFLPTGQSPLKNTSHASATQRLNMLQLALADTPQFKIDTCELDSPQPSYTVNTLQTYRQKFPLTPLCFIMGVEQFINLPQWHHWQKLLDLAHIIVVSRPDYAIPTTGTSAELLQERLTHSPIDLNNQTAGLIFYQAIPEFKESSTLIRKWLAAGKDCSEIVPKSVLDYIRVNGLYQK